MAPAFVIHNEDRSQIHCSHSAQGSEPCGEQELPLFAPSPPATLVPMRSTESKIRLERGAYLNKKRSIDFITYREGCPIDKHSKATVRDEDSTAEMSGNEASRDDCSNSDGGDAQQKDGTHSKSTAAEIHSLYVVQKTGTKSNHNQSVRVSKAYSFEEYWKIFDSVVEGCRCISIAGCAAGGVNTPVTSFGNSIDEADGSSSIANKGPARLVHTPAGDGNNNCYYGQVTPQNHRHATSGGLQSNNYPSPTSSTANVGPSVASTSSSSASPPAFLSKGGANYPASSQPSGSMHKQPPSLRVLRDLERELSDDDDFRPAHRTSACFVLHEKDKVNDIFR